MLKYEKSTVPDFDDGESVLSQFQSGTFGAVDAAGTVLNDFKVSIDTQTGDRCDALVEMQQDGLPLRPETSDFAQLQQ